MIAVVYEPCTPGSVFKVQWEYWLIRHSLDRHRQEEIKASAKTGSH